MVKGIFQLGVGAVPKTIRLEVLANNIANINTTGYKKDRLFFEHLSTSAAALAQGKNELAAAEGRMFTDFSEGSLHRTNNPLDLAIQGGGFFVVQTPQGERLTRNGNFMLALDGTIVTSQGYPVMGSSGVLRIPDVQKQPAASLAISENGEITIGTTLIGKLRLVRVDELKDLKKAGNSMFAVPGNVRAIDIESKDVIVRQGFLEESNVEGIAEMIELIELSRQFETEQKLIQQQDSTLEKAMDVGRLP